MTDPNDPKGLIREAYRIEGISLPECRTIFLDWALGVPSDADPRLAVTALLERYAGERQDHPMTDTLKEALNESAAPKRRGGRAARLA